MDCRVICGSRTLGSTMKKPVELSSQTASVLDEPFDVKAIRSQFPILSRKIHGKPLVYFDNAATTQKPRVVIDALRHYYERENANIHRGVHTLSQEATGLYEAAREKIARFINAAETREVLFTRGTTEGINLVAQTWGRTFLKAGDEIVLSAMEHHSNIVPWQILTEQTGAKVRVIPMNDRGELRLEELDKILGPRTKLVSIVHLSNSLGTINPVAQIIKRAHALGAVVVVDGAQWVAHGPTDVRALDADFYAFSGHKLYGPTGIGVLYGKAKLLEAMPPWQGGGDMISSVTFEKTTYAELPHKFEAGTPHIAGGIGLGVAIDFVSSIGLEAIARQEQELLAYATARMNEIAGLRIVGTAREKGGVISFVIEKPVMSSLDIGMALDADGIAVRTGHHCCQPVMDRLGINSTARASLALYNTREEIDVLVDSIKRAMANQSARPRASATAGNVAYPPASAATPTAAAQELIETFEMLGDPQQQMQFVIELGEKLPPMPAELKTEPNHVLGCMSLVHLAARRQPGSADTLEFLADSDAALVRGLIAILQQVYSGQSAGAVLEFDVVSFLRRLGLDQHLTTGRRNGLESMIKRIRGEAAALAEKKP
jgi:cysteine desulfurase / selenocysteine lyase